MSKINNTYDKSQVQGMLYWTYDTFEQERLHHAASDWELFVQKMGSFEKDANVR